MSRAVHTRGVFLTLGIWLAAYLQCIVFQSDGGGGDGVIVGLKPQMEITRRAF